MYHEYMSYGLETGMTTTKTRRFGAQIVFTQRDRILDMDGSFAEGRWTARLLNPEAIDRTYDAPVGPRGFTCFITGPNALSPEFDSPGAHFVLVTQGAEKGGRRYRSFRSLTDAQEAAIKWAARRFCVEAQA